MTLRRTTWIVAGALAVFALWAMIDLLRVVRDVRAGQNGLQTASAADLARPHGLAHVADTGLGHFKHADKVAHRAIPFRLLHSVPVFRAQLDAVRSMTATAVRVAVIGDRAAHHVQTRLDATKQGAPARVALLDTALNEVQGARRQLATIDVRRRGGLLPPLAKAQRSLRGSLGHAREKLAEADVMLTGLRKMIVGPSWYLVLAGNNAEMRAGGMPLSVGTVFMYQGKVTVGRFLPTGDLTIHLHPAPKPPEELNPLYFEFAMGRDWRGTAVTPNFPVKAELWSQMVPAADLGNGVDGVIYADALALRSVVHATGPVDYNGIKYTDKNIVSEVLNENYIRYPDPVDSPGRYDLQAGIAKAVFSAIDQGGVSFGRLIAGLSAAGRGRHVLAWSKDRNLQYAWQQAGIDGRLDPNGLQVNLQNVSANKLDYYITPTVRLRTLSVKKHVRRVAMSVYFANKPRKRTSPYIEGVAYDHKHGMSDGEHAVYAYFYLPYSAFDVSSAHPPFTAAGLDGPMKVAGFRYSVEVGQSRTVTIEFSVPEKQVFHIIPSGRAHPVPYSTSKRTVTDDAPRILAL